jgi:hypothetical protein
MRWMSCDAQRLSTCSIKTDACKVVAVIFFNPFDSTQIYRFTLLVQIQWHYSEHGGDTQHGQLNAMQFCVASVVVDGKQVDATVYFDPTPQSPQSLELPYEVWTDIPSDVPDFFKRCFRFKLLDENLSQCIVTYRLRARPT